MTQARILVVEDEVIVGENIRDTLENLGYSVVDVVSSAAEALASAAERQPDVVLMDIKLQGERDGIEAAEHIQGHQNIPVIYVTAYTDTNTLQRAKITEPFGYIIKPFEARELHISIEIALYKHRMENERKQLLGDLQRALENVKTLSGLIPICANCKKIRNDKGYWMQIERFLQDYSAVHFSHSICPECMKNLYPDFVKEDNSAAT